MTIVSQSGAAAAAPAATHPARRNAALDRTRTFLTVLVLIHHAVIPYTYFGHTDDKSWLGFDCVVLATDSFFMAMFFMLSGLFLWPSLDHRPMTGSFARDRLVRLGLPFAITAVTIIPIAYYALALRETPQLGFAEFWRNMITVGPWPSGPLWFLWVLLIFNLIGGALYRISPQVIVPLSRLSRHGFIHPVKFFLFVFAVTALVYVPMRLVFGPSYWFEFGPFSVQASRVLFYAVYFFVGAGIGAAGVDRSVLCIDGQMAKGWWGWALLALVPYGAMWGLIYVKREILDNPDILPQWYEACYGLAFAAFSAAIIFAILAFFLRFRRTGWSMLDPLQNDAYGIFLVHYAFMLWLQYWLFDYDLPAVAKAAMVLVLGLTLSWIATSALRKIPGAYRVL
ncbi:MAG: acyltransferase [Rhodopseudomonas sp.]|uniref:acyltransferase family protein n=1 Tax=Rhodopseudomonas sp. TaxID=1078 RepID=UPI0018247062|nr:acyltransferase [Rhodopseudomonas sp.]NVN84595.1 acyltransferase [Rhodopseudomonas sp.]